MVAQVKMKRESPKVPTSVAAPANRRQFCLRRPYQPKEPGIRNFLSVTFHVPRAPILPFAPRLSEEVSLYHRILESCVGRTRQSAYAACYPRPSFLVACRSEPFIRRRHLPLDLLDAHSYRVRYPKSRSQYIPARCLRSARRLTVGHPTVLKKSK